MADPDCTIKTTLGALDVYLESGDGELNDDLQKLYELAKQRGTTITCVITVEPDEEDLPRNEE